MTTLEITDADHDCYSVTDGEWIVFRCPRCPSYERRVHVLTGEMRVVGVSEVFRHSGKHEMRPI